MESQKWKRRCQFRLVSWFWMTLVVAAFFLGRNWETCRRLVQAPASTTESFMFGTAVNSDAGVTGAIVVDEDNFSESETSIQFVP